MWAGPFCTQNLAHLGAEVIRVETMARTPCVTRLIPRRRRTRPRSRRLLQPVQPGQEQHLPQPPQARSGPPGLRPGRVLRRRHGQRLRRGDRQARARLPQVAHDQSRLLAPHETYKARGDNDKWVSIAVATEEEWHALCHAIGQPGLATDARFKRAELRKQNEAALDEIITAWTSTRDRWDAAETLQQVGVAAFPSMSNKDPAEDPHATERGYLVALEHPVVGRRIHARIPWTISGTPCTVQHAAPLPGVDSDEVLQRLLGLSPQEIDSLRAAEAIY